MQLEAFVCINICRRKIKVPSKSYSVNYCDAVLVLARNVHEGIRAQSKKDFESKMSIALKEASETEYWLEIFKETDYLTQDEFDSMNDDCIEIIRILTAIINTSKKEK